MPPLFRYNEPDSVVTPKLNAVNERPVQVSFVGKPSNGQVLWRGKGLRKLEITAIDGDSDIAATNQAVFTLTADGQTVATITWAAAGAQATGAIVTPQIAADAVLKLTAPATQDGTLADGTIWITFREGG